MVKDNLTFPGIGTHHPCKLQELNWTGGLGWLSVTAGMDVWGTNALSDFLTQESELTPWEAFLLCENSSRCLCSPCPAVRQKLISNLILLPLGEGAGKAQFGLLDSVSTKASTGSAVP